MSAAKSTPVAFDSAYAGSMFEKPHGSYILRDDPGSLAAALLEAIAERDRKIEDLEAALQARDAHDELVEALKEIAETVVYAPEGGHEEVAQCVRIARDALAKAGSDGEGGPEHG